MPNRSSLNSSQFEALVETYKKEKSLDKTAVIFNTTPATVRNYLIRLGVPRFETWRKIYQFQENRFTTIDTEEKAYWLGFLAADGCVFKSANSFYLDLGLATSDIEHLEKFRSFMGDETVAIKTRAKLSPQGKMLDLSKIRYCSKTLFDDLNRHGVVCNKTDKLQIPCLEPSLLRHYWRGLIDGDGWFYTKVTPNGRILNLGICGTEAICIGFKQYLESLQIVSTSEARKKKSAACWSFEVTGVARVHKAIEHIYKDSHISLSRKLLKAQECLDQTLYVLQKTNSV